MLLRVRSPVYSKSAGWSLGRGSVQVSQVVHGGSVTFKQERDEHKLLPQSVKSNIYISLLLTLTCDLIHEVKQCGQAYPHTFGHVVHQGLSIFQ